MEQLASVLRRQRHLLEILLFKLVSARHLLAAGEVRFLPWAAQEVERAVERVRESELERAIVVHQLSRELDIDEEQLTLRALSDESPEPYRTIFRDHRQAFLELSTEIEQVSLANRKLAGQGMRGVHEVLSLLEEGRGGNGADDVRLYGPDRATHRASTASAVRFDGAL